MDGLYDNINNEDLKIDIDLAGMIILASPDELPDLVESHKNTGISSDRPTLKAFPVRDRLGEWKTTKQGRNLLPPNDHVMLFTAYALMRPDGSLAPVGISFIRSICDERRSSTVIESGRLIMFDAIIATHELGHSLGAHHDGLDLLESSGCPAEDNYIMSSKAGLNTFLENRFHFSCCSQRNFYVQIQSEGECLNVTSAAPNYPSSIDDKVTQNLPGQVFDADDQCYVAFGTSACDNSNLNISGVSLCVRLFCVDPEDPFMCITQNAGAAEGTECGHESMCLRGKCVKKRTHLMPEKKCSVRDCYGSEKKCKNGTNISQPHRFMCYHFSHHCDSVKDCSDGSDESDCEYAPPTQCSRGNTRCQANGYSRCIPDEWLCDGEADCDDASDENCSLKTAAETT